MIDEVVQRAKKAARKRERYATDLKFRQRVLDASLAHRSRNAESDIVSNLRREVGQREESQNRLVIMPGKGCEACHGSSGEKRVAA